MTSRLRTQPRHVRRSASLTALLLASTAIAGLPLAAQAQTTWKGTTSNDWFTGSNWSTNSQPTASTDAIIDTISPHPTVLSGFSGNAKSLDIGLNGNGSLSVQGAGSLTVVADTTLGANAGSSGTLVVSGAGSSLNQTSERFTIGENGVGTFTLQQGATATGGDVYVNGSGSSANINSTGSSWTTANLLLNNAGALNVSNGGLLNDQGALTVGGGGTVNVYAAGTILTDADVIYIGDLGAGTINVLSGGSAQLGFIAVGGANTGSVSTTPSTGVLAISSGGVVTSSFGFSNVLSLDVGEFAHYTGTVTVDGAGSQLLVNPTDGTIIGDGGQGSVQITNGGAATAGAVTLGQQTGSSGGLLVNGAGSSFGAQALVIGASGTGSLQVETGGVLTGTSLVAGQQAGSTGTVTVVGSGAKATFSDAATIGDLGNGTLVVVNGAHLTSGAGSFAFGANTTGTASVAGANSLWTLNGLLSIGASGVGALNLSQGGEVDVTGAAYIASADNGGAGANTVTLASGSKLAIGGDLYDGLDGSASLTVQGGGVVTNQNGFIANSSTSTGKASVDGAGSKWTSSGDLHVGVAGAATLTISNGGVVHNQNGLAGVSLGSTADITVDGAGSIWNNDLDLSVGGRGLVAMTVSNGGVVYDRNGGVAVGGGSTSTATVTGAGSEWDSSELLTVGGGEAGGNSKATLNIWNGGVVGDDNAVVGDQTTGTGTVLVDAADWLNALNLTVGQNGTGTLTVQNGGFVTGSTATVGAAGVGTVNVHDPSSLLQVSGDFIIGGSAMLGAGTGTLNIANGGAVTSVDAFIGASPGSHGFVTVTGAGSKWTGSGGISVADLGTGSLIIANGGSVSSAYAGLGASAGGSGTAVVDGAGSDWATVGSVLVGDYGSGVLTLSNGGAVTAQSVELAGYAGSSGTLVIGADPVNAPAAPGVVDAPIVRLDAGQGSIVFNHTSNNYVFSPQISGLGAISQVAGVTHLTGDASQFTGGATVQGGTLLVDDSFGSAAATVFVQSGGTLGGTGSINGGVSIAGGGTLVGVQGQTLTMDSLLLGGASKIDVSLGAPSGTALFAINNNLTLAGTLNVNSLNGFGPGVYRLMTYGGALTDDGLSVGSVPGGTTASDYTVQTSVNGQVNLVNLAALTRTFWDGDAPGSANNNAIDGGSGTWTNASTNWVDVNGQNNGVMAPQPGFAIFEGAPGTVTVSASAGAVAVTGMQFASNGYHVVGAPITLSNPDSIIRVGDGTAAGAGYTATIDSMLTGAGGLDKTDLGTLILGQFNNYSGGTTISAGTLQIGNGAAAGSIYYDIVDNASLVFDNIGQPPPSIGGVISGTGSVTVLADTEFRATNTYSGGTTIGAGATLYVGDGANSGSIIGDVVDNGRLLFQRSDVVTFNGAISGGGGVTLDNEGATRLSGINTYSGATVILQSGELDLIGGGSIAGSSGVNVGTTGKFDISGTNTGASVTTVTGGGVIALGGRALTLTNASSHYDGAIQGAGTLTVAGGAATLDGANTYTGGTTIAGGATLQLGDNTQHGAIVGTVADGGALVFDNPDATTFGGVISGAGQVRQAGSGATSLTAVNTYTGGTAITGGVLTGQGSSFGTGAIAVGTALVVDQPVDGQLTNAITGTGSFTKQGGGVLALTGASTFSGPTAVTAGGLQVNGSLASATVQVASGATISGMGTASGAVTVADGATLMGVHGQTFNTGSLALGSGSQVNVVLGAPGTSGLFNVAGDLKLDGTLNVSDGGGFGTGVYRLFDYGGTLTGAGLGLGSVVAGTSASDYAVQTAAAGQVNLLYSGPAASGTLNFWDGDAPGSANNNAIDGGSGTWTNASANWVDVNGQNNGAMAPPPGFAIFEGAPGTVTVSASAGAVAVTGMQFASNGYHLVGAPVTLSNPDSMIRVGDGTAAGSGYSATIDSMLTGAGGLDKTDLGTLILTGQNDYSGGTTITGGALALSGSGSIQGPVADNATFDISGTNAGASIGSLSGTGNVVLGGQTLSVTQANDTFSGAITGSGGLNLAGILTLTGASTYTGGTTIGAASTLYLGDQDTSGSIFGDVIDNGGLIFARSDAVSFDGAISGTGGVAQLGTGSVTLSDANTYTGGTYVNGGTLIGSTSSFGSGELAIITALVIQQPSDAVFSNVLLGSGSITKQGAGVLDLTGDGSSFTGATHVAGGKLLVDGALGSSVDVASGAALGGAGSIGGPVTIADGGALVGVQGQTLTMGSLALSNGSDVNVTLGAPGSAGLFNVTKNLTLDGVLNISSAPGFGVGVYRLFDYGGTLTDDTLDIGTTPSGATTTAFAVQTSVAGQVNLVDSQASTLSFWDGVAPGAANNGIVDGGNGTWSAVSTTFTDANGSTNGAMTPQPGFVVFEGAPGAVSVDASQGTVAVTGMQFAVDGYRVSGDPVVLADPNAVIRVGDGTAVGAGYTATIDSQLTGAGGLNKTDLGTLILTGQNDYSGGTTITDGTLQIGVGGTSGSIVGDVIDNGKLVFDRSNGFIFGGAISGAGSVTVLGTATLAGASTYTGGTFVAPGATLNLGVGAAGGSITGDVDDEGRFAFNRSDDAAFNGVISGAGTFQQGGTAVLSLGGVDTYTGRTLISSGALALVGPGSIAQSALVLVAQGAAFDVSATDSGASIVSLTGAGAVDLGARALTLTNAKDTFSGSIGGTGALVIAAGQETLTGANSYTGGTAIGAGAELILGDNSPHGSILGDVADGGLLVFDNPDATPFGGVISGAGGIRQAGGGVTTLTGANTFTGATDITGGALALAGGGSLTGPVNANAVFDISATTAGAAIASLSGSGSVVLGAQTLTLTAAADTFSGSIGGAGGLKVGGGMEILTGANTYAGGTTVAANAALEIGNGGVIGSITGDVATDGALAFDRSDAVSFGGVISGTGAVFNEGAGTTTLTAANTYTGSTVIDAGTVRGSATSFGTGGIAVTGALVIDQPTDAVFANTIVGAGGFTKTGAGSLNLTGTDGFTGATTVAMGRLAVNGYLGGSVVTVQSGATLGGNGVVGGVIAQAGANVGPGNSIGLLTVNGDYSQAAGSTYQVELTSAGASDRINVTGKATIAPGAILNVTKTDPNPYVIGAHYTVLNATGGVTGAFDLTGDIKVSDFLGVVVGEDASNVYLDVTKTRAFAQAGHTANQVATGAALDSLPLANGLVGAVANLQTDTDAQAAFDQLSGEAHASVKTAMLEDGQVVRDAATSRLRSAFGEAGLDANPMQAGNVTFWGRVFDTRGVNDGGGAGDAKLNHSTDGFLLGGDVAAFDHWRLGLLAGYGRTNLKVDSRQSSGSSDDYHLGLYAGTQEGPWGLRLGAAYSWHDVTMGRSVAFAGFGDHLNSHYDAGLAQAFADIGYRIGVGHGAVEPFADLAFESLSTDAFTEHGGLAALSLAGDSSQAGFSTLGLRGSERFTQADQRFTVRASAGWRHVYGDVTPNSTSAFAVGGSSFTVEGAPLARDSLAVDLGLDMAAARNVTVGISYSGQLATHAEDNAIKANLSWKF